MTAPILKLVHPSAAIGGVEIECIACGATGDAPCACGLGYNFRLVGTRVAKAVAANPEKSDRAIAAELGVSHTTVQKARKATGNKLPVETRTGRDGKVRKLPRKPKPQVIEMPTAEEAEESWQDTLYDEACLLLERMADETRQRFFAHIRRKYP